MEGRVSDHRWTLAEFGEIEGGGEKGRLVGEKKRKKEKKRKREKVLIVLVKGH